MSFVNKAADIQELVDVMDRLNVPAERRPKIYPRIERTQALANLDDILKLADGVVVALAVGETVILQTTPLHPY